MRPGLGTLICTAALAAACIPINIGGSGSGSTSGTQSFALQGAVTLPQPVQTPVRVVAQTQAGQLVGAANSAASGAFVVNVQVPVATQRLLLMAVLPSDPNDRAYGVVDLGTSGAAGIKTQDLPTPPFVTLDADSSATAVALAATGNMGIALSQLQTSYSPQIAAISTEVAAGDVKLCSASATTASGGTMSVSDAIRSIEQQEQSAGDPGVPDFISQIVQTAKSSGDPASRMAAMKQLISQNVNSVNYGVFDAARGLIPLALARVTIGALTNETINSITDNPVTENDLAYLAGVIGGAGWGNCREKAYMAAFAAGLMPEVQQVAVLGLIRQDGSAHAVAVACLDGPDMYKLTDLSVQAGNVTPPAITSAGRCFVIDPWLGPTSDPTAGTTAVFDATFGSTHSWDLLDALKPVKLDRAALPPMPPPAGAAATCDCARGPNPAECDPFTLPSDADAGGATQGDDGGATGADASTGTGANDTFAATITVEGTSVPYAVGAVAGGWAIAGAQPRSIGLRDHGEHPHAEPARRLDVRPHRKPIDHPGAGSLQLRQPGDEHRWRRRRRRGRVLD